MARRIGDDAWVCSLENHLSYRAMAGPAVPVVDTAKAIALWWARHDLGACPTDDQMVAASAPAVCGPGSTMAFWGAPHLLLLADR